MVAILDLEFRDYREPLTLQAKKKKKSSAVVSIWDINFSLQLIVD